eukprot:gene18201-23863_t
MNHRTSLDMQSPAEVSVALHMDSKLSSLTSPLHEELKEIESNSINRDSDIDKGWSNSQKEIFRLSDRLSTLSSHYSTSKEVPDMWSKHYVGLYCQYAAIGLLYGTAGALTALCVYVYNGPPNLCANSSNITFFAWSFKIVFAVLTDTYRPFGLRRKPWMLMGWAMVLVILLVLTITADKLDASSWVALLMLIQFFAMFSDVPADGYSVELGQLEPPDRRGVILATGQIIRFSFCMIAGLIQAVLLNGPTTNESGCAISFDNCWSWGLTINQYYALLFVLVAILTIPIIWLKETDPNWRYTQYGSTIFAAFLQCAWILVYYNVGNLQNPWFTIFIDLDQYFVMGLTQVLFSLAVIELSSPGLEATTYELLITVANASGTLCVIIGTQLLTPLKASACSTDDDYEINCPSNSIDVNSQSSFNQTDGPYRYTFKEQCAEWKEEGEKAGNSTIRGYISLFLSCSTIAYGFTVAILLIDPSTSCLAVVGGTGC